MSAANKAKGQHESHTKGVVGEARWLAYAASQGWHLYKGFNGHEPCDYIADTGDGLIRVEVKYIESIQQTQRNYYYVTATKLDSKKYDYLFVATISGDYFIPSSESPSQTLSIKVVGSSYERNISRPGKYEVYRVVC